MPVFTGMTSRMPDSGNKAELDYLVFYKGKRLGFEFKYKDAPTLTKSMRIVMEDLKLDHLFVIYPGPIEYPLDKQITVIGLESFHLAWLECKVNLSTK